MTTTMASLILGPMSNDVQNKLNARKCILEAAVKLFAKLGLDKCSTREIAKESDSNISLISYYFGGKEGLYKEVMRNYANEIKESVEKNIERSQFKPGTKDHFVEQVSMMVENMIHFRVNYPDMAKIFAREKLTGMMYANEIHEEIFYPMKQKFFEAFQEGQKQGFIRAGIDPGVFFMTLSEGVWGFFQMTECQMKLTPDCLKIKDNPSEFKDQILKIYLTGVLT
jgi:AcrR family transcriptional regulator